MPKLGLDDDMSVMQIGGTNLQFTGKQITQLGASEYTLAVLIMDISGSLGGYERQLEKVAGQVVEACRDPRNPRADNMMLMVMTFNDGVYEIHGFRPVMDLNPDDYKGKISCGGCTAARDAAYQAIKACETYGRELVKNQFSVNACVFLLTDGLDNESKTTVKMVAEALKECTLSESLESMLAVLIGVGTGSSADVAKLSAELTELKDKAGFAQYVYAGTCSPATLARIGQFVSQSASSQSQHLGTGGPSQALTF